MKEFKDNYYLVRWNMKQTDLLLAVGSILLLNVFFYIASVFNRTGDVAGALMICMAMDCIAVVMIYLAVKVPYCRWKKLEKNKEQYMDITEMQNKYRKALLSVYYGLLIVAYCGVVYNVFGDKVMG
jgi:uncharacterized membrane protein